MPQKKNPVSQSRIEGYTLRKTDPLDYLGLARAPPGKVRPSLRSSMWRLTLAEGIRNCSSRAFASLDGRIYDDHEGNTLHL